MLFGIREPCASGNRVAWLGEGGYGIETRDPEVWTMVVGGSPQQITANETVERSLSLSGDVIVWTCYDLRESPRDYELLVDADEYLSVANHP